MLSEFRGKLRELGIDAFIVGSGDAHQSEYVHASDKRRQFISGFSGSAGTALITMDSAFLWTDGRYFLQASQQLSADWTLMKSGEPGVPELNAWILANMQQGQKVGVDPNLVSASEGKAMEKAFLEKGIVLFPVPTNPVDSIWKDRPAVPSGPICVHESAVAGQPFPEKVAKMQEELSKQEAAAMVVCMLDEVAWLLNIRGTDVLCCPVVISYAVVTSNDTHLFVDEGKVTAAAKAHLDGVTLHSYSEIESYLSSLKTMGSVLADPAQLNWKLYIALGESIKVSLSWIQKRAVK
jgi:Xaa-Pro aminopeptidase